MRIKRALVENFRGVRFSELNDLGDLVVLAGQNGSGKSCILDAIRLIKSVYGGYQQNEFHQWFSEFQINFSGDPRAFASLFNDQSSSLAIEVDFEIHHEERRYLRENATNLITAQAWRALVPELYDWRSLNAAPFTAQFRSREPEVKAQAQQDLEIFNNEIELPFIRARMFILPNSQPKFNPSKVLELIFSTFDLKNFGIIDYHGPHRNYGREVLHNINVNIAAIEEQKRQSTLYNYNAKYSNVKGEMAGLYVREAIAEKGGFDFDKSNSVTETLKELFTTFFPDKEFLGPQPTAEGGLRFPVKVGGRESHDLDELSSGEKEILYGYLRLRSSAPKNSVILLDEPELHLNPSLTRNLPDFYHRKLAKALDNQIWLITHSDAILRESVGRDGISVFHITPSAHATTDANQARRVEAEEDLEKALINLVGDLAAYQPGGDVVIFEGEDSDFDLRMVSDLFPELAKKANLVSGTNKSRVRGLHDLLHKISQKNKILSSRIFSIVDQDSDGLIDQQNSSNKFSWDAYHIENYLLESKYIRIALANLFGGQDAPTEVEIDDELQICAQEIAPGLIVRSLSDQANALMINALNTRVNPNSGDPAGDIITALNNSRKRMNDLASDRLSESSIRDRMGNISESFDGDLSSGRWKLSFPGREILKRFVGKKGGGLKYTLFRNLIIARMRDDGFRPEGMETVIAKILQPRAIVR